MSNVSEAERDDQAAKQFRNAIRMVMELCRLMNCLHCFASLGVRVTDKELADSLHLFHVGREHERQGEWRG
jgi:hypothetical protein